MNKIQLEPLWAVVGVWIRDDRAYYVRRSDQMTNYPGVWSLFSIQYPEGSLSDPDDIAVVQPYFERMAGERLKGAEISTLRRLASDHSDKNPIERHVFLHLYEVSLKSEPALNPAYYTDARWMTFDEYELASANQPCGLCTRMWGDYGYLHGLVDHPFIPARGNAGA